MFGKTSKGLVQLHCKYIQCNFNTFYMFFILKYVIVNFIIQKLKSKHTSLKKYTQTEQKYLIKISSRLEGTREAKNKNK